MTAAQLQEAVAKVFEDAGIGLGVDEVVSTTVVRIVEVRVDAFAVSSEAIKEALHGLYCEGAASCSVVATEQQRNRRVLDAEQPGWSFNVARVLSANDRSNQTSQLPTATIPAYPYTLVHPCANPHAHP